MYIFQINEGVKATYPGVKGRELKGVTFPTEMDFKCYM